MKNCFVLSFAVILHQSPKLYSSTNYGLILHYRSDLLIYIFDTHRYELLLTDTVLNPRYPKIILDRKCSERK